MRRSVKVAVGLIAGMLCFGLVACHKSPQSQINCASSTWAPFELLFIAEKQGYFDPDRIHIIEAPFTVDTVEALRAGSIDASDMSLFQATRLAADGVDLTVVMAADDSAGADMIIGKPEIRTFADLKGKHVAVRLDGISGYFFVRALEANGMTLKDIDLTLLATNTESAEVFPKVDAVVSYGEEAYKTIDKGGHVVLTSRDFPDEMIDVLAVRSVLLQSDPEGVAELVRGWMRARALYERSTPEGRLALAKQAVKAETFMKTIGSLRLLGVEDNVRLLKDDGKEMRRSVARYRKFLTDIDTLGKSGTDLKFSDLPLRLALEKGVEP